MYEKIISRITQDSKKVHRVPLTQERIQKVESSVKELSLPFSKLEPLPIIASDSGSVKPTKKKTPIVKPISKRFPTKRVDFDNDIPWL